MSARIATETVVDALPRRWRRRETLFATWTILALVSLPLVAGALDAAFPIFTVIWLLVPLVAVLLSRDAGRVGFRAVPLQDLVLVTVVNMAVVLLIFVLVEPSFHAYTRLLELVRAGRPADTTFAWLMRYEGVAAWGGLVLFSGLVTMFAEELFFRGWLLQLLLRHLARWWAIAIQAVLFTLPQSLVAFAMIPVQGLVYIFIYSWLTIGIVGGWAAARTNSIWPGLLTATLFNLIACLGVPWTTPPG